MITLWKLIAALPELFKLIETLDKRISEASTERKVSDDVRKIHEAFSAKSPDQLIALFSSS